MNIAVIDVGSNTIRMNVYLVAKDGTYDILTTRKVSAGLASYVRGGRLGEAGVNRLCGVLNDLKRMLAHVTVDRTAAFATATLRNIANTNRVLERVVNETGFELEVLSGETEARLGYEGVKNHVMTREGVLLDIGGGSTEISRFTAQGIEVCSSYPIGSLNLFTACVREGVLPTKKELKAMKREVRRVIHKADTEKFGRVEHVSAIGGSTRAFVKLANNVLNRTDGGNLFTRAELREVRDRLFACDRAAIDTILKTCPHRIHTILPGLLILSTLVARFKAKVVEVCSSGVREGYLERILAK